MSEGSAMEASEGSPVPIVVEGQDDVVRGCEHMMEIIDSIEKQVESLRTQAAFLEEEKDGIVCVLDTIRQSTYVESVNEGEREEILLNLDRLSVRVSSVDVTVRTIRDELQQEALSQINSIINKLISEIDRDTHGAKILCISFLNTCMSDPESGPTDKQFEVALLGCTLDDQKRIRKRLHGLLNYLERKGVSLV